MNKNSTILNDLYDTGFKIYQNDEYFKFSLDSLLLAKFVKPDYKDKKILDLCTGNAPIPIILSSNNNFEITGIEMQKEIYHLASESIKINNIKNVNIINDDVKNLKNYFPGNNFDIITCNPPYFKVEKESLLNKNEIKSIARHEITIDLEKIIKISSKLLNDQGILGLVHRPSRLIEIVNLCEKYSLEIKKIQFVYPRINEEANIVLIEAIKNGKSQLKVLEPIITYDGLEYTNQIKKYFE